MKSGARCILTECLRLSRDERLLIVYDDTAPSCVQALQEASEELRIVCRPYFVPLDHQMRYQADMGIPIDLGARLDESRGVLTCLTNKPDKGCTEFRRDLVQRAATGNHKRVGHMPGITEDIFASSMDIDYASMEQMCDDLALALTVGESSHLLTFADGQEPAQLVIGLGAWARRGVVSSGRIPAGTWGNLPGGETFIAPLEGTAHGSFFLNGSFKGQVLPPGEALRLEFESGRLVDVSGGETLKQRFWHLTADARESGDKNWNVLAELGIGVNSKIERLFGNPLSDEKCMGTAHIAIGDNTDFGGESRSKIHEDLITRSPSLRIGGKDILSHGEYVFQSSEWRENICEWPADPTLGNPSSLRMARGLVPAKQHGEELRVECAISDRLNSYTLGDGLSSPLLAVIYSNVPLGGRQEKYTEILKKVRKAKPDISDQVFERGIAILLRHRVVVVFR